MSTKPQNPDGSNPNLGVDRAAALLRAIEKSTTEVVESNKQFSELKSTINKLSSTVSTINNEVL